MTGPILVFDGDCAFCRFWIDRWRLRTGDRLEYHPFQSDEVARRFPQLSRDRCQRAVRFVDADGTVYEAAEAVLRALAQNGGSTAASIGWLLYRRAPGFPSIAGLAYRLIARHRPLADRVRKCAWGSVAVPSTYRISSWLFLRFLGLTYLVAFWSLGTQIVGLIGHDGIQPASIYMTAARSFVDSEHIGVD